MALISIKRNVDLQPGLNAPAVFNCSQSDKGTTIMLGLMNGGNDYTVPSGVTITIRGSRSNGAVFTPVSATSSGSTVSFTLTEEMTDTAGPTLCEAVLEQGNNVLGTANFIINVEGSPMGADVPPVFTDAAWAWMVNKIEHNTIPSLGETIPDAIDEKADQTDLSALQTTVAGHTGSITVLNSTVNTLNQDVTENRQNISLKLDKNQGAANAGKYLKISSNGAITPVDLETETDKTLSVSDKAADAKATGDALALKASESTIAPEFSTSASYTAGQYVYKNGVLYKFTADHSGAWDDADAETVTVGGELKKLNEKDNGIRRDIKEALLQIARKVAYIDTDGEYYYEALYESLMITGISAVYVQRGIVYDNDSLNSLKTDLIVTATYENGTSKAVTDYTLSGVLTVGTSNITVMYHGESATFAVNVTESPKSDMDGWSDGIAYTNLTIVQNEYAKASNGALIPYDGWDRTGYVPCDGASTITFPAMPYTGSGRNVSNWFYTENKTPLSGGTNGFSLNKTQPTVITVPQDAYYYIISCTRDALASCINGGIVPHE